MRPLPRALDRLLEVHLVHLLVDLVILLEPPIEEHRSEYHDPSNTRIHDEDIWILGHRTECHPQRAPHASCQLDQRLHNRLHVRRRLAIRVLTGRHKSEDLADRQDKIDGYLHPHVDVVG